MNDFKRKTLKQKTEGLPFRSFTSSEYSGYVLDDKKRKAVKLSQYVVLNTQYYDKELSQNRFP